MYESYASKQGNSNSYIFTEAGVIYPLPENYMVITR